MASTGLLGSFPLTHDEIDRQVSRTAPGTYALGYVDDNQMFRVKRIGRSDDDVNNRIHDYVSLYKRFKYGYSSSAKAAFEKECQLYHDFDPPDNAIHPDRPDGTNWTCPRCTIFD